MAARLGIEPRQTESESVVLPLHHQAVENLKGLGDNLRYEVDVEGNWSRRRELNLQPPVYKTGALPLSYAGIKVYPKRGNDVWLDYEKNV